MNFPDNPFLQTPPIDSKFPNQSRPTDRPSPEPPASSEARASLSAPLPVQLSRARFASSDYLDGSSPRQFRAAQLLRQNCCPLSYQPATLRRARNPRGGRLRARCVAEAIRRKWMMASTDRRTGSAEIEYREPLLRTRISSECSSVRRSGRSYGSSGLEW